MKRLIVFIFISVMSSAVWSATVSGTLSSLSVSWAGTQFSFRYFATLSGSSKKYFLEVKDGRSQAVVDAQYSMLLTAYATGDTVTFVTDYDTPAIARIRDLKITE